MGSRLYAGQRLRALRQRHTLGQNAMAARLGVSVSYLSQLENDDRPLTSTVLAALGRQFPLDLDSLQADDGARRFAAARAVLDDPLFGDALPDPQAVARLAEQQPDLADRLVALHAAYRAAEERLQMLDETIDSGAEQGGRLPWDEIRDWFHQAGNYVDLLDRGAETLSETLKGASSEALADRLAAAHGVIVEELADVDAATIRRFDAARRALMLGPALPPESRRFQLAWQLVALELGGGIAAVAAIRVSRGGRSSKTPARSKPTLTSPTGVPLSSRTGTFARADSPRVPVCQSTISWPSSTCWYGVLTSSPMRDGVGWARRMP